MKRVILIFVALFTVSCTSYQVFVKKYDLGDDVQVTTRNTRIVSVDTIDVYGGDAHKRVIFERVTLRISE